MELHRVALASQTGISKRREATMTNIFTTATVTDENIKAAEHVLIDNGIEQDEAWIVLQAIGYALISEELYPEN